MKEGLIVTKNTNLHDQEDNLPNLMGVVNLYFCLIFV